MNVLITIVCVAYANESQEKAERIRLSGEMKNLAKLNRWSAANSKYLEILELKKAKASYGDHYTAAQIAAALGDMYQTYVRIERAYAEDPKQELKEWMELIKQTSAPVNIEVKKSYKGDFSLNIDMMPMIAEEQKAVKYAQKQVEKERTFKGLLPFGEYTIADKSFSLVPIEFSDDSSTFLDVDKIIVRPPPAPPLINKMGPRVFVGAGYSGAGTPTRTMAENPTSFGGMGIRGSIGWQIQFRFGFDLVAEVDFRNIMLSGKDVIYKEEVGLTAESMDFEQDRYNAVGLTSGISYPIGNLNIFGGASFTQGFAVIQGLDTEHSSSYTETCKPQLEEHMIICDERVNVAESLVLRGVLLSVGPTLGLSYNLLPIGKDFLLGASTMLGIQSDTSRAYYWGQLGLTISPSRSVKK